MSTTTIKPGTHVTTVSKYGRGTVLRHHPHMAAWIVRFPGVHYDYAYTDDQLWTETP